MLCEHAQRGAAQTARDRSLAQYATAHCEPGFMRRLAFAYPWAPAVARSAQQRFASTQAGQDELVLRQCKRVTRGELFRRAEEIELRVPKRLRGAPQREWRLAIILLGGAGG